MMRLEPTPAVRGALPFCLCVTATAAAAFALSACSGRLDHQEASQAAVKASGLFQKEFAAAAPKLTARDLQVEIESKINKIDDKGAMPRLGSDAFSPDKPVFVTIEGASGQLAAVEALCADPSVYDLDPASFECERLAALKREIGEAREALEALTAKVSGLGQEHVERLASHLMTLDGEKIRDESGAVTDATLVSIMFGRGGYETPLPHVEIALEDLRAHNTALARRLAELEIHGHQIVARFVWEMRAAYADQHWEKIEAQRKWLDGLADDEVKRTKQPQDQLRMTMPEGWPESGEVAQVRAFQALMAQMGQSQVQEVLESALPPGDQYRRLMGALALYREIVAAGGFVALKDTKSLSEGKASAGVPSLRERLAQEGYAPGTGDPSRPESFDGGLKEALREFQRNHQVQESGKVDKPTLKALEEPAGAKLAKIRLAMRKWREAIPMTGEHVFVNIPDFHGELWDARGRTHRFRVVVGSTTRKWEKGKGKTLVNATPETMAQIDRVVYNPFWNVPKRIFQKEILGDKGEEMEDEARIEFLSKKGFQVMGEGTDYEWIRQPPGPGNALGQVKIIFPNPYEIYMHDTQSRNLFQRPVRAFSHGCVRVHEPLTLARLILELDGSFDGDRVEELLESFESEEIFLKRKLPIYINYITVRVGDEGRSHFLSDVYDRDGDRLAALGGG